MREGHHVERRLYLLSSCDRGAYPLKRRGSDVAAMIPSPRSFPSSAPPPLFRPPGVALREKCGIAVDPAGGKYGISYSIFSPSAVSSYLPPLLFNPPRVLVVILRIEHSSVLVLLVVLVLVLVV